MKVRCASGSDEDLDLAASDVEGIVSDPIFLEWVEAVSPELLDEARQAQSLLLQ